MPSSMLASGCSGSRCCPRYRDDRGQQASAWWEQSADLEVVCALWFWREAPTAPGGRGTSAAICQAAGSLGAWPGARSFL